MTSVPPSRSGSTPISRIDRGALARNLGRIIASRAPDELSLDLRGDAFGHGDETVATVAASAGIRRFVLDPDRLGAIRAVAPDAVAVSAPACVAAAALYGFAGAGEPAMSLVGAVMSTKDLAAGEGVSYGYRFRAARDTRIALVTGGYAQGVVRSLGGRVSATIGGVAHPIVGRVAMDVCVLDIGAAAVERGAEAVFFGSHAAPLSTWAAESGLTEGEIAATVGARTKRVAR